MVPTCSSPLSRRSFLAAGVGLTMRNLCNAGDRAAPVVVGINLSSFGRQLRSAESQRRIALFDLPMLVRDELAISLLDLPSTAIPDRTSQTIDGFRKRAADAGCTITNLKVNAHNLPFADHDPAVRTPAIKEYKNWIRTAAELGARWLRPYPSATAPDWATLISSYRELAEFASNYGITLLVENYRWLESKPNAIPQLVHALDGRIAAAPDTANWPDEQTRHIGLRQAFPLAVTADFKVRSFAADGTHNAYDLRAAFNLGRMAGFNGPWCLEHADPNLPTLLQNLRKMAAWLRTW